MNNEKNACIKRKLKSVYSNLYVLNHFFGFVPWEGHDYLKQH